MSNKSKDKKKSAANDSSSDSDSDVIEGGRISDDKTKKKKLKKSPSTDAGVPKKATSTNTEESLKAKSEMSKSCCAHGNNTCSPKFRVAKPIGSPSNAMYEDPSVVRPCHLCAMSWSDYHRLETIYRHMEALVQDYPCICCIIIIGRSVEGRELRVLKISNGSKNNTSVWIDGGIHAREWIAPAVVTYMADQLARNFFNLSPEITSKDWYMFPVMNPDGYEYTFTHDRMWRKNRVCHGETIGVDLNRNFSVGWDLTDPTNDTEDPGSIYYRGPCPFSEPETAAVRDFIIDIQHEKAIQVFMSFHSYGEIILFPWGHCPEPCPDYVKMLQGATIMAKAIFDETGNTYRVGSTKDLMYFATGTNIDWCYSEVKIPFCYMIELPGRTHKFALPREEILCTCIELWSGVLSTVEFADHMNRQCTSVTPACFEKEPASCKRPICVAHSTSSVSFKGNKRELRNEEVYMSVNSIQNPLKESETSVATVVDEDQDPDDEDPKSDKERKFEKSYESYDEDDKKPPMRYEQKVYTNPDSRRCPTKSKTYEKPPEDTISETDSYDSYYSRRNNIY